jgi:hypothetical protein
VAYARDSCGNASPVSAMTSGVLDYHLGDVSDGSTPGQGDNSVNVADASLLGAHYGASGAALSSVAYLDVGPTTTAGTTGRPVPDGSVDFEDLILFALNFAPRVSAPAMNATPSGETIDFQAPASTGTPRWSNPRASRPARSSAIRAASSCRPVLAAWTPRCSAPVVVA